MLGIVVAELDKKFGIKEAKTANLSLINFCYNYAHNYYFVFWY